MARPRLILLLTLGATLLSGRAVADSCTAGTPIYMALEPVKALVGFNGETRTQYLDRLYPGWQDDTQQIVRGVAPIGDEAMRIALVAPTGLVLERADVVVESAFDYVDRDGRVRQQVGHREIARYPLAADAASEIAVPKSAFRESGSLLVVLTLRRADVAGARGIAVGALPVELNHCPRRVYTHDRFAAIRLNRGKAKSPPR